ncbi:MAG: hypothetical protein U0637_04595 [Phycisphaerales bacterium]
MQWKTGVALVVAAGIASVACASVEQGGAQVKFEVYDPVASAWTSSMTAQPGQQVEWRVVVSYTGTRTDLFALGDSRYQPTLSNTDNVGAGALADQLGVWRTGGVSGSGFPGSMLSVAEGAFGGALPDYGRVTYGGTGTSDDASYQNLITTFRHSLGSAGAPAGSWIRVAGSFVTQWPRDPITGTASVTDTNRILRGIPAMQVSMALNPVVHLAGVSNLVVFRQAIVLSDDSAPRTIEVSTFRGSFLRMGTGSSTDDRRYITWQTGPTDMGSHRTLEPDIIPASITLVPGPSVLPALAAFGAFGIRRRRAGC